MGILSWLRSVIGGKVTSTEVKEYADAAIEYCIRELAFQSAVNLIANAVSKCEFRTFDRGKKVIGPEYYTWNVQPNKNQNSSEFIKKWIYKLYRHNEALIIESDDGQLLVADSFIRDERALYDSVFTQVTIGDFDFKRTFYASEVMYFRLNHKDVTKAVSALYESYGKMLTCGIRAYQRGRGIRSVLKMNATAMTNQNFEKTYEQLTGSDIKTFVKSDYATLPIYDGFDYEEMGSKNYSADNNSRDIRALADDIFDFYARAFSIPPTLLRGELADTSQSVDNLLTFCIDPLTGMLSEEINAKRTGQAEYTKGTRVQIFTHAIKHVDVIGSATNIDKLVSSGVFCINDVLEMLGESPIDEPWAYQRFITKNYELIENALIALKGGET